jgi:hypothetical protein
MVRTVVHTCNICNKNYASYQSLWNHRTNIHKSVDDNRPIIIDNHPIIIDNQNKNEQDKTYDCRICNKEFKYFQNRWRHEKSCSKKSDIINNTVNNITNNTNNNTNNGTINNTTNNTIVINNFNEDNLNYISENFMKRILNRLTNNDDESLKGAIPHLVENIKFNPNFKENNNAQITNVKSKIAKKYTNNKWMYYKKDLLLKEMHNKAVEILQKWVDENKALLTNKMMDGLKDYKNVSNAYKKKIIHDEINLLAYNYYKNHIEESKLD